MIDIHLHWAWLLIAVIVIAGVAFMVKQNNETDQYGIGAAFGCFVFIVAVLAAAVIGGIFIW